MTLAFSRSRPDLASEAGPLHHAARADEVLDAMRSAPGGLSSAEAARRLAADGENRLPRARPESPWKILGRQVANPLILVLLGSAVVAALVGKPLDGAVVLGVVVLNALFGFVQEVRAGRAIEALTGLVPVVALARRDGHPQAVPAETLVPGDVILLTAGDKVPADGRLIEARGLRIDESALTGESVPADKDAEASAPDAALGDRRGMAFSGTLVTQGTGVAVVTATGLRTELGRISALLQSTTALETPLTRSLARVARWVTAAVAVVAVLLLAVALGRGMPLADGVLSAVTLAVAAIPEGLPAIVTIALAIGVRRMARRRAIVRKLPAVETLGSTTVICSDKTGTLTKNEMTVQATWTPRQDPDAVPALLRAAVICNDATPGRDGGKPEGDPTETALLAAAERTGLDPAAIQADNPRLDAIPFDSARRWMATVHREPDGTAVLTVKGAPEEVLARCTTTAGGDPLDAPGIAARASSMARDGLRVLAVATTPLHPATATAPDLPVPLDETHVRGLALQGLVGMIDPARPEAIAAVARCRQAGIEVKMITGDHPETAAAVARQAGLADEARVVTGRQLDHAGDDEFQALARDATVFARVSPEHKLRLVQALQADGHVVAMTGDGVNDAPALRQADIGVAMGITGTAASREAADVVLTDDDFATIAAAVEEGRRVWDNLVKALAFVLPTNLGEALIILVGVAFFPVAAGMTLMPVSPLQILWLNLVTTVALALPLAFEALEPGTMRRPPRKPGTPLLGGVVLLRSVIITLLLAGAAIALFLHAYGEGVSAGAAPAAALARAQTAAVTAVVLFQVFYLLACRSLEGSILHIGVWSNPAVWAGIAAIGILQAAFVHLPALNALFGSAPLGAEDWFLAVLAGAVVLPAVAIEKAVRNRWRRARAG